jgi:hypothetical protein
MLGCMEAQGGYIDWCAQKRDSFFFFFPSVRAIEQIKESTMERSKKPHSFDVSCEHMVTRQPGHDKQLGFQLYNSRKHAMLPFTQSITDT